MQIRTTLALVILVIALPLICDAQNTTTLTLLQKAKDLTPNPKSGEGNRDDLIPAIGGQQYGYLLVRLRHFKQQHASQERQSLEPAVVNLLERLSPDEIKAVADYTSRLPALQGH
jgi:hypothetical protein